MEASASGSGCGSEGRRIIARTSFATQEAQALRQQPGARGRQCEADADGQDDHANDRDELVDFVLSNPPADEINPPPAQARTNPA